MIELKTETMQNAINKAKAERNNLIVRLTEAVRMYRVESRQSGKTYTVNFFVRNNRRFGHCTCPAGEQGRFACKHLAAAAALNTCLAEQGRLNRKAVSVAA
ncbi:MAG TPA: SWIM zinc finger family protein [Pyrinomonadaceae bacterium]